MTMHFVALSWLFLMYDVQQHACPLILQTGDRMARSRPSFWAGIVVAQLWNWWDASAEH